MSTCFTILIFGGTIIALLSSIAIRERKYEIGVLRAMGMKKHKVALGLWSEMLIITCLCLVVGLTAGTIIAQPVTDVLLNHQIEAAEASSQPSSPMGGMVMGGNIMNSDAEPLQDIHISLGFNTMLQVIGIGLLLASLAALISIRKITRYEPIKILMERN
ncbi:ABC transporter permease [Evansella halocellulosilytica]|uniref:ABC transporter permease n=1 Tax=Evansella halocellulosilytica TaxID=2011013 RepID=UPI000BB8F544|nr:ABC transporter permease [Evansella halocellulosilytica]